MIDDHHSTPLQKHDGLRLEMMNVSHLHTLTLTVPFPSAQHYDSSSTQMPGLLVQKCKKCVF